MQLFRTSVPFYLQFQAGPGSKNDKEGDVKGVGFISQHSCKSFGNHLT